MRLTFVKTITELAARNPRIMLLTADLGFQIFDEFRERFGPRYVNVGVAEAQMICAAAGLASEGWRPFTYSIASFHIGRAYEQIRVSVNYPGLPVVIVGVGGGYGYAHSGVTHHAVEDFALMAGLPGMTVVAPGDANEVMQLVPQIAELSGPCYLRIGRGGEPVYEVDEPAVLGRARLLRQGEHLAVLSTGEMASTVLSALSMLGAEGITPIVYQFHTLKPFDAGALEELATKVDTVITVEEHLPNGGLNSMVNSWRSQRATGPQVLRLGPPDALALGNPHPADLRQHLRYDADAVAAACRAAWKA